MANLRQITRCLTALVSLLDAGQSREEKSIRGHGWVQVIKHVRLNSSALLDESGYNLVTDFLIFDQDGEVKGRVACLILDIDVAAVGLDEVIDILKGSIQDAVTEDGRWIGRTPSSGTECVEY